MFDFKKKNKKEIVKDSVSAEDIISAGQKPSNEMVETSLSLSPNWNMPSEERYVFAFHNSQSPKLKVNQISIFGVELKQLKNNNVIATALIKNTVPKKIHFQATTILLLGADKEILAKREFDLKQLGTLPPNSARPWKFVFTPEHFVSDTEVNTNDWSLAFEIKKKHKLDLEDSWEKSIAEETKASLENIVAKAKPLKPGEVNFMGIQAKQNEKHELIVTILIRNGSDKNVTLQQVPLGIKDVNGEEVAKGSFKLKDFTVKANTSKPWTFIFPESMVSKDEIDLSKWQAYPIQ